MQVTIAGGTGFIGQFMANYYLKQGHKVSIIGRSITKIEQCFAKRVRAIDWNSLNQIGKSTLAHTDLVINLAGATIGDKRWTPERKKEIISSRIESTKTLATLCAQLGTASPPLFNASAVGIYGLNKGVSNDLPPALDESTPIRELPDFASKVVRLWEAAAQPAKDNNVRVIHLRFGVVFGKHGGALARLKLPFQFFIGGRIGSGHQPFSWVCIVDLCRAVDFLFDHPDIQGPVNIVSPGCVTQRELAKQIGNVLHKPSFMITPEFMLKLVYGQMAEELLLNGQHATPKILLENGFTFQYPDVNSALRYAFN